MSLGIIRNTDFLVVLASLTGALVYILTQHHFDKTKQPYIFVASFLMGMIGDDATLNLVNDILPNYFTGDRAVAAFLCSALVVTVTIKIIAYVETKINIK
ncbi:putative holin [Rahnella laticis]|uniref:putative holin n=1 Tax=Rahnella laticis TaxID=2787622 RepID=UPI0018A33254|nr:putative holin [Rahnella laticis]MBF7997510.1 hypothetical protein [Rahnella laticis]